MKMWLMETKHGAQDCDEILTSEDVGDESEEHRVDTKDEGETRYIYVEETR